MPSTYARNEVCEKFALIALYASVHSGDPGTTGANEIAGSTRALVGWGTPSGGVVVKTAPNPACSVPAGNTVTHGGLWDAVSGGNFIDGDAVTNFVFTDGGTYTFTTIQYTQAA